MKKNKILSVILVFVILLQLFNVGVYTVDSEFTFSLSDDGTYYTVTGIKSKAAFEINVPDEYSGKPVCAIASNAFSGCVSVYKVTLPQSIKSIEPGAFSGLPSLHEIIPAGNGFASVDGVLFSADKKKLIAYPQGLDGAYTVPDGTDEIFGYAFYGASGLTSVALPSSLKTIGSYAFQKHRLKVLLFRLPLH